MYDKYINIDVYFQKGNGKGHVRDIIERQEKIDLDQKKTKVKDIVQVVKQLKWRWAGHVARMNDNRWTKRLTDWHPYGEKRSRKRPDTRWKDEIEKFAGVAWQRLAQDRQLWKQGKAFVQQWTYTDDDDQSIIFFRTSFSLS